MSYNAEALWGKLPRYLRESDFDAEALAQIPAQVAAEVALDPGLDRDRRYRELLDEAASGPLHALLEVLAEGAELMRAEVERLYDDLFVETAANDLLPYLAEALGVRLLRPLGDESAARAWVANALRYRRRKGTVPGLRELAQDVLGHRAAVVEAMARLEWTQNLNHLSRRLPRTPDLRNTDALEHLGGPFETAARTLEVRRAPSGRGRYGIRNVLIYDFTLRALPVRGVDAAPGPADRSFRLDPLGRDFPLFVPPRPAPARVESPLEEFDAPAPLRRRLLHDELERLRAALARGETYRSPLLDPTPAVALHGVPPEEIVVVNLDAWGEIPTSRTYPDADGNPASMPLRAAVDPVTGRVRFAPAQAPETLLTDHVVGAPALIGGGPYSRQRDLADLLPDGMDFYRLVTREPLPATPNVSPTLADAIADWNAQPEDRDGLIVILDSRTYDEGPLEVQIPEGSHLLLLAAGWPESGASGPPEVRDPDDRRRLNPEGVRPTIRPRLVITGTAGAGSDSPGQCSLSSLWLEDGVTLGAGELGRVVLADCSLFAPLAVGAGNADLELEVRRTYLDSLNAPGELARVRLANVGVRTDCLAAQSPLELDRVTVLGAAQGRTLEVSESIVVGRLVAERTQEGCVRFSSFGTGSRVPRAFRCQPETAVDDHPDEPEGLVRARVVPSFRSVIPGDPLYLRLGPDAPPEIAAGAEDEEAMGVHHDEYLTLRRANLRSALPEFLRAGLEAGLYERP